MKDIITSYINNYLLATLTLLSVSCAKDPNPCKSMLPTSADFKIEEEIIINCGPGFSNTYVESDTVAPGKITLIAKDSLADSYTWKIGRDPRTWNTRSVSLSFDSYETIEVTLIVKKKANTSCFVTDNGIDTISKSFTIVPLDNIPISGKYQGYNVSDKNNIFIIEIHNKSLENPFDRDMYIENLPIGCTRSSGSISMKGMGFGLCSNGFIGNNCKGINAIGILQPDGKTVIIDYTICENNSCDKQKKDRFIGTKID